MTTYMEMQREIVRLQEQALAKKEQERPEIIADLKAKIHAFELTAEELGFLKNSEPVAKEIKYQNPTNGLHWSGKGRQPKWLKEAIERGGSLQDFEVNRQSNQSS